MYVGIMLNKYSLSQFQRNDNQQQFCDGKEENDVAS